MLKQETEIIFKLRWFSASKHINEKEFFIQICNLTERENEAGLNHKHRLWQMWSVEPDINFYFFQLNVPHYEKS